jgi:hypothetical protein
MGCWRNRKTVENRVFCIIKPGFFGKTRFFKKRQPPGFSIGKDLVNRKGKVKESGFDGTRIDAKEEKTEFSRKNSVLKKKRQDKTGFFRENPVF